MAADFEKCWHQYPCYQMLMTCAGSEGRGGTQTTLQSPVLSQACERDPTDDLPIASPVRPSALPPE